jgi:hypothetical protein
LRDHSSRPRMERARLFITKFDQPKMTRPRTKTSGSGLGESFRKQMTGDEIAAIIDAMEPERFIAIEHGKVTYASAAWQPPDASIE